MKAIHLSILSAVMLGAASLSVAGEIDVMTQNQYIGADLQIGVNASTQKEADDAVVAMLTTIAKTCPAERVRDVAAEIAHRNPDVVACRKPSSLNVCPIQSMGFRPCRGGVATTR